MVGAIFSFYRDSCQHLLAAAACSCGCLAFACVPDSLRALGSRHFVFLAGKDLYKFCCASVHNTLRVFRELFKGKALKEENKYFFLKKQV